MLTQVIGTITITYIISNPFNYLDLVWGSQGQSKAKPVGFIFSVSFQMIRVKFDEGLKQFKLNILILLLSEICMNQGK